jgi:hypothetical protein
MGELPTSFSSSAAPRGDVQSTLGEAAEARIRESLALLDAIGLGELLSALPAATADRKRHATAVWLLDVVHDRLEHVLDALKRLNGRD